MPVVTFRVYPPEFRWGEAPRDNFRGGLWIARGLALNDDIEFNTTNRRFISLGEPLFDAGATEDEATFSVPKPLQIHTLALMFDTAFAGGASATFQFNVDGVTNNDITLSFVTGEQKGVATGFIAVSQGQEVCLECTAVAGGPPNLQSIVVAYRTQQGDDPTV